MFSKKNINVNLCNIPAVEFANFEVRPIHLDINSKEV